MGAEDWVVDSKGRVWKEYDTFTKGEGLFEETYIAWRCESTAAAYPDWYSVEELVHLLDGIEEADSYAD